MLLSRIYPDIDTKITQVEVNLKFAHHNTVHYIRILYDGYYKMHHINLGFIHSNRMKNAKDECENSCEYFVHNNS